MKTRLILFITVCIYASSAMSQEEKKVKENKVPQVVKDAFKAKYPNYKPEGYEMNGTNYEVLFDMNKLDYEAVFSPEGKWSETEREIKQSALPKAVSDAFAASEYKNWKVTEVTLLENTEYKELYELEIKKDKNKMEIFFTPDGKRVKK